MDRVFIAVYIELENVANTKLKLDALMKTLELELNKQDDSTKKPVFAIKSAYGALDSIGADFKKQLMYHGFYMFNTPKIGDKKNSSDLFISLDAFESLYLNNPNINRYIFLTSDLDFTVIGEKIRKYGKEVWLVCRQEDRARVILSNAFDKLLFIEQYYDLDQNQQKKSNRDKQENDRLAKETFIQVLKTINLDKLPCNISVIHERMKLSDPGLDLRNTSFGRFNSLANHFEEQSIIETSKEKGRSWMLTDIKFP